MGKGAREKKRKKGAKRKGKNKEEKNEKSSKKSHLGAAVLPRLDVRRELLVRPARVAEVDDPGLAAEEPLSQFDRVDARRPRAMGGRGRAGKRRRGLRGRGRRGAFGAGAGGDRCLRFRLGLRGGLRGLLLVLQLLLLALGQRRLAVFFVLLLLLLRL